MADDTGEGNSSNGLDLNGLMGNLIGSATVAYQANQASEAAQSIAQAQAAAAYANPGNPIAFLTTGSGKNWLIIGAGLLALALILRR